MRSAGDATWVQSGQIYEGSCYGVKFVAKDDIFKDETSGYYVRTILKTRKIYKGLYSKCKEKYKEQYQQYQKLKEKNTKANIKGQKKKIKGQY